LINSLKLTKVDKIIGGFYDGEWQASDNFEIVDGKGVAYAV